MDLELALIRYVGSGTGVSVEELHIIEFGDSGVWTDNYFAPDDYRAILDQSVEYLYDEPSRTLTVQAEGGSVSYAVPEEQTYTGPCGFGAVVSFLTEGDALGAVFGAAYIPNASPGNSQYIAQIQADVCLLYTSEIYVKYSPLGNNNLEQFLLSEGAEPVVPGLTDFVIFKIYNRDVDVDIYGGRWIKQKFCQIFASYIKKYQRAMIDALNRSGRFRAPGDFDELHHYIKGYLGDGNKMGEGWLLTAEMLELIHTGRCV